MSSMMSVQTTEDGTDLPSFSAFSTELDPTWDYYDRDRSSSDVISSQSNSYTRPWEMETKDKGFEPFSKLPSFQSQFHSYAESNMMPEPSLPQVTPVPVPMSPNSAAIASPVGNGSLTQLTPINPLQTGLTPLSSPSFHTLTAVNTTRSYPLVPAPIQARDIPTIQQQYLDERHIQLYQPITTYAPPPPQNMVTILKSEPPNFELKNGLHHSSFQNPMLENGFDHSIKIEKAESPRRNDARKKERRKIRASSLESSAESESSAMEMGDGNPGQVAAVSSTASFKSPMSSMSVCDEDINGDKQTKKKRKRCGECIGCQKKDNCGDCAPCRNDKSHQICKQRRCEKLTDKKIYGADGSLLRAESRRGRGKGRGGSSARGRKAVNSGAAVSPRAAQPATSSSISPAPAAVPHPSPNTASSTATTLVVSGNGTATVTAIPPPSTTQIHQQQSTQQQQQQAQTHQSSQQSLHQTVVHSQIPPQQAAQQQHQQQLIQQQAQQPQQQAQTPQQPIVQSPSQVMKEQSQQPMTPMAFYPTWQADPSQGWQNQFIQQIPQSTPGISALNSIDFQPQSYAAYQPSGYVQGGLGFDPGYGRTYAAPVQRYEFQSNQISPINQVSLQSVSFAPTVTYAGQVSTGPAPMLLSGQNDLSKTMSGNDMPGYPRVSSVPQHSLNCNGYSGEFSGNQQQTANTSIQSQQTTQQQQQTSQQQQSQQNNNTPNHMHPPQVPQSPSRSNVTTPINHHTMLTPSSRPSPNHQLHSQIPQSPNHHQHTNGNSTPTAMQMQTSNSHHGQSHSQLSSGSYMSSSSSAASQHALQQSPNHNNSQMVHGSSAIHTPNTHPANSHINQSPNHHMHHASAANSGSESDWSWNNQGANHHHHQHHHHHGGNGDSIFNQSDRVNLNTRLKTMILSKNDQKDPPGSGNNSTAAGAQQNSQAGHFLSYSHHLRDVNTDGNLNNNSADMCLSAVPPSLGVEPTGGGGLSHWKSSLMEAKPPDDFPCSQQQQQQPQQLPHDQMHEHREGFNKMADKSHIIGQDVDKTLCMPYPTETHHTNSKSKSSHKSLDLEKPVKKPAPKRQRKKPNASAKQSTDDKKFSNFMPSFNKANASSGNEMYGSAYGANSKYSANDTNPTYFQPGMHAPDPLNPFQSEFNMKIKQEPLSSLAVPPPRQPYPIPPTAASGTGYPMAQVKMEGYERNYQNFINYADYCQSQNNSAAAAAHQEYGQAYGNYPPYSSSAYHHAHHQSYPNSPYSSSSHQGMPNFSSIPSADSNCSNSQTMSSADAQDIKPYISETDKDADIKNANLTKLTNYEKDIPIHTYPNHGRFTEHHTTTSHHTADGIKNKKIDDVSNNSSANFPFFDENGSNASTAEQQQQQHQQPFNGISYHPQTQGHSSVSNKDHLIADQQKLAPLHDDEDENDLDKSLTKNELVHPPVDRTEKGVKPEVPNCDCFAADEKNPPEPGSYYTHLGSAASLAELRSDMENRIGVRGRQLRIEKVIYSGKEGKTSQGCPLAKWIIRRVDKEEKILCIVKRRQGHKCKASFIVVCIVAWDGMPKQEADNAYRLLVHKLNKFGLPTTRRCATNENRTCACQGLDPETSGASFSFGCSWSMYYNGCKYARSKTVRKFRLSVKSEEAEIEEHMNVLATILSPLYMNVAPKAYDNQCKYENEAPDCRLGLKPGKPFSGVTTCMDFCAHAHRDLHNMQDGCTVQVGLLKPRPSGMPYAPPEDEQLHILPLYVMDTTDEFDSAEAQKEKHKTGAVQALEKFPCEVRVRATPLLPCRRHGKKRNGKDGAEDEPTTPTEDVAPPTPAATPAPPTPTKKESNKKSSKNQPKEKPSTPLSRAETPISAGTNTNNINNNNNNNNGNSTASGSPSNSAFSAPINQNNMMNSNSNLINMASMIDNFTDAQLQSNQISSTVLDSPYSYDYATGSYIDKRNYYNQQWIPPHAMDYAYPPHDRNEQVKSRGSEENPDSTTIINANNSGSAFSPSVVDVSKLHDPLHTDAYGQKDHGFVKPKPPEYPTAYGYHHSTPPTYPMYPTYPTATYNQPHHYNNLDYYNNDKLRYNFYSPHHHPHHHHQSYNPYDIYHPVQPVQTLSAAAAAAAQNQTTPSNWNLFSPAAPSAVPVLTTPMPLTPPPSAAQSNATLDPSPTLTTLSPSTVSTPQPVEKPEELPTKAEPIGEITEINDNIECFQDSQMGGIGIALEHGSVLIECAKHEMHATTSLKTPNRQNPTRITLIFYQHRNLNRHRHGIEEWEEKMRLKRLGITIPPPEEPKVVTPPKSSSSSKGSSKPKSRSKKSKSKAEPKEKKKDLSKTLAATAPQTNPVIKEECEKFDAEKMNADNDEMAGQRTPALTTPSWTTLFPMRQCVMGGPYQEGNNSSTFDASAQQIPPSPTSLSSGTYPNAVAMQQLPSPMQTQSHHQLQ